MFCKINRMKALVVDDSEFTRNMVSDVLKFIGFEVINAKDGKDALEKSLSEDISLFMVDINMPRMDGYTLIRKLREQERYVKTPIVILSTEREEKDVEAGLEAGADLYLKKPIKPKVLLKEIKKILKS